MAEISLLQNVSVDDSGRAFPLPLFRVDGNANGLHRRNVIGLVQPGSGEVQGFSCGIVVPADYSSGPKINVYYFTSDTNTGNVARLRLKYNVIGNTESFDPASYDENKIANAAPQGTALARTNISFLSLTGAFAGGKALLVVLQRDDDSGNDTSPETFYIDDIRFAYTAA